MKKFEPFDTVKLKKSGKKRFWGFKVGQPFIIDKWFKYHEVVHLLKLDKKYTGYRVGSEGLRTSYASLAVSFEELEKCFSKVKIK